MSSDQDQKAPRRESRERRLLPQVPGGRPVRPFSAGCKRSDSSAANSQLVADLSHLSQTFMLEVGSRLRIPPPGVPGKREFVSPVKSKISEEGEDCSVTVAVRVRPFSKR